MKNLPVLSAFCLLVFSSCEKTDKDVFFRLGSGQEYRFRDIELYDTSTDILYLRTDQGFLEKMYENTFAFVDNGKIIYEGRFHPGYSSSMPKGPFIMSPPMYGLYALKIDNWFHPDKPDVRKDPALINILDQNNLLHQGLRFSASSVNIIGSQLTFRFTITNSDQADLMIIDPDKTGPGLFHYFTNGLYILDSSHNEVFSSGIQPLAPDPWNSWKTEWLSVLKSGESREFTIVYAIENTIPPGDYETSFEFPGLGLGGTVARDQLYQGTGRIWLGEIIEKKRITIP